MVLSSKIERRYCGNWQMRIHFVSIICDQRIVRWQLLNLHDENLPIQGKLVADTGEWGVLP